MMKFLSGLKWYFWYFVSRLPSGTVRAMAFRLLGGKIGNRTRICCGVEVRGAGKIKIGSNTIIGTHSILDGRGGLRIGDNVNISSEVMIWTAKHRVASADFETVLAPVVIGSTAWLGPRSIVMPGVNIGEGAVVFAAAVVTKDVAPYSLVAGVPAVVVGERPRNSRYTLDTNFPCY